MQPVIRLHMIENFAEKLAEKCIFSPPPSPPMTLIPRERILLVQVYHMLQLVVVYPSGNWRVFDWAWIWEVTQLSVFIKSVAQREVFLIVTRGCDFHRPASVHADGALNIWGRRGTH